MYIDMCIYIYIYIYIEREREIDRYRYTYTASFQDFESGSVVSIQTPVLRTRGESAFSRLRQARALGFEVPRSRDRPCLPPNYQHHCPGFLRRDTYKRVKEIIKRIAASWPAIKPRLVSGLFIPSRWNVGRWTRER